MGFSFLFFQSLPYWFQCSNQYGRGFDKCNQQDLPDPSLLLTGHSLASVNFSSISTSLTAWLPVLSVKGKPVVDCVHWVVVFLNLPCWLMHWSQQRRGLKALKVRSWILLVPGSALEPFFPTSDTLFPVQILFGGGRHLRVPTSGLWTARNLLTSVFQSQILVGILVGGGGAVR